MKAFHFISLSAATLALTSMTAAAQSGHVRFTNKWKPNQQINVQNGPIASSPARPGWFSADWSLERVPGTNFFRIKNRWRGTYIHNQTQPLEAGPIRPNWWSAMWSLEQAGGGYVRIRNRWKGTYINIERGRITASQIRPGWLSAQWKMAGQKRAVTSGRKLGVAANSRTGRALVKGIGEQCVGAGWPRKFVPVGYAAKVRWYYPTDVIYNPTRKQLKLRRGARAAKVQTIHNPFKVFSCINNGKKMIAQVNVVGAEWANNAISIAAGTVVGVASSVGVAVACAGSAGAGCALAAGVPGAVSGAAGAVALALPDPKTVAYFGSPKKVILSGTIWKPTAREM